MLEEEPIARLIDILMDEWYGNGRLDNRGFVSLATLEISRTDINLLCKPQSKCGALKFEINRDRTHMIWRGDQLPTYEPATPAPTVCSFTKLTESNHTLLGNMLTNGPKQRPKKSALISFSTYGHSLLNRYFDAFTQVLRFSAIGVNTNFLVTTVYQLTLYPNATVLMRKDDKFNIFVYNVKYRNRVCIGDLVFT